MLITVIAVENLRQSAQIQGVQKQSVDSLYKAEEGIEFSLYANKQKNVRWWRKDHAFNISVWDNGNDNNTDAEALDDLAQPTQNRNIVVTSENVTNRNDNMGLKRTVFANLPSRYYNQVPLWDFTNNCDSGNCIVSASNNDMESGHTYQVFLANADFQKDGWTSDKTEFRLIFACRSGQICTVKNLRVGVGCNYSECPSTTSSTSCTAFTDIDFWDGQTEMTGNLILSDWFKYMDNAGNTFDLRNNKMLVQFDLVRGIMEEASGSSGEIKMCKQNSDGSWIPFTDRSGGLASVEARRVNESGQYECCKYLSDCEEYEQLCDEMKDGECVNPHNGKCLKPFEKCIYWCKVRPSL